MSLGLNSPRELCSSWLGWSDMLVCLGTVIVYTCHPESESHSVMSNTLRPNGLYSLWNSPGQNTGMGSFFLLQGIFPTQGLNPDLLHYRQILYQLSYKGKPKNTVGSLSLLEWIFLTQKFKWGLLRCRWIIYQLSYQGSPNVIISSLQAFPKNVSVWMIKSIWLSSNHDQVTKFWMSPVGKIPGEGNGHTLQYSFLEIPWAENPGRLQSMGSQKSLTLFVPKQQQHMSSSLLAEVLWGYLMTKY